VWKYLGQMNYISIAYALYQLKILLTPITYKVLGLIGIYYGEMENKICDIQ